MEGETVAAVNITTNIFTLATWVILYQYNITNIITCKTTLITIY